MPSTATSILDGISTSVAVKPPCRTVATTNITLAGLQTISGYTTEENDRVLVKGQTNGIDNGIYMASTGSWTRAKDADGNRDLVQGTRVLVRSTTIDGVEYELTTANPIVIGTTALTFVLRYGANATYDQTEAEIAAVVTPTNDAIPSHDVIGYVDPLRYGTNATPGTTDMTTAINTAISVAKQLSQGGTIQLPLGDLLISGTLALNDHRLHMRGAGMWATRLIFAPTASDTAIELGATGLGDRTSQGSLRDLALWSADSTYTKIGIDIVDVSAWDISNIAIQGDVEVPGVALFWSGGTGSVGIRTRGRELTSIGPLYIYADKPIQISDNPSNSIDCDHFHFHDCTLAANGFPIVTIDTGVNLSSVTFDGHQSWNLGTDGLRWVDTTSSIVSLRLALRNVRWEQGDSASDYLVRIEHNTGLQGLVIDNCYGGLDRSGFYLRKVENVALRDSSYIGAGGFEALNVDATVKRLTLDNMFWQTSSTAATTGQKLVSGVPLNPNAAPLRATAYYDEDANADENMVLGSSIGAASITVANDGVAELGTTQMAGFIDIVSNSGECARFQLNGTNNTTAEVNDTQGVFSVTQGTASSINIYWNAGSSTYRLENKRGGSRNFRILHSGSGSSF